MPWRRLAKSTGVGSARELLNGWGWRGQQRDPRLSGCGSSRYAASVGADGVFAFERSDGEAETAIG